MNITIFHVGAWRSIIMPEDKIWAAWQCFWETLEVVIKANGLNFSSILVSETENNIIVLHYRDRICLYLFEPTWKNLKHIVLDIFHLVPQKHPDHLPWTSGYDNK